MKALYSTLNIKLQKAVNDKLVSELNEIIQHDIISIKSDSKIYTEKLNIVPIKYYANAESARSLLYRENRNKVISLN